uniref:BTB/POZ domain-containing protein KCTD5 n=1 Tax=Aceria tosichella TaxID=561515 RepID=A0A6G1SPH7_9ACAR
MAPPPAYVRFDVRGQHHLTHHTTIMNYPDSLFADLIEENPNFSSGERIKIDRDPKHFETILNLMRVQKLIYAGHLDNSELNELLQELKYYRLTSLESMVSKLIKPLHQKPPTSAPRVMIDHSKVIQNIERPTLAVSSQTVKWFSKYGDISTFLSVFDHRYYDVIILTPFSGQPLEPTDDDDLPPHKMTKGGSCYVRLGLYVPKKLEPVLVMHSKLWCVHEFIAVLYKYLIKIDAYIQCLNGSDLAKISAENLQDKLEDAF